MQDKITNMNVPFKSFENVAKFKYLVMIVTNQNYIHEEIESKLNFEKACYHEVQNHLSSQLLPINVNIKTYKTISLPLICMSVKLSL
jgi:hypothetical protein